MTKISANIDGYANQIASSLAKNLPDGWDLDRIRKLKKFNGQIGPIPVDLIITKHNIRKEIDKDSQEYKELIESIKKHGVLQPPIVTVVENEHGVPQILLVGGGRRIEAAKELGYTELKCMVKIFDADQEQLSASIAENMNRKNLHPLEVAECFGELASKGYKQAELSRLFGRDRITILRDIKISKWPVEAKSIIRKHPEKFTSKKLAAIARRKLSDAEVLEEVKACLSRDSTSLKKKAPSEQRVTNYFKDKQLDQGIQDEILIALESMKFISKKQLERIKQAF